MNDDKMNEELRAAARAMQPPQGTEARVASRLAATFASPPPLLPAGAKIALSVVTVGVASVALLYSRMVPQKIAPAPIVSLPVQEVPEQISPPAITPPPAAKRHTPLAAHVAATPSVAAPPVIAPPARTDSLAEEQQLLESARHAFAADDTAAARASLATYDQHFAHGELSEERDALWIYVLAREGHGQAARQRFAQFEHDHAASPLRDRLRTAIEEGEMQ